MAKSCPPTDAGTSTFRRQMTSSWNCTECTLENPTDSLVCGVCGKLRNSDGWNCALCTFYNEMDSLHCSMCKAARDKDSGLKTMNNMDIDMNRQKRKYYQLMDQSMERPHKKQRCDTTTDSSTSLTPRFTSNSMSISMERCPVCDRNLQSLSMDTREIHINFCLDTQSGSASKLLSNRPSNTKRTSKLSKPISSSMPPRVQTLRSFKNRKNRKFQRNGLRQYFGAKPTNGNIHTIHEPKYNNNGVGDLLTAKEHYHRFKVIHETNIVVDGFVKWNWFAPRNAIYFLSHFHSDHYVGLSAGHFEGGVIYCSPITARLVESRLGVHSQCIRSIPMFTKYRIEHSVPPTFVTMLDANHCPGAVMMLFEVHHGADRVSLHLHLGDARCEMESDSLFHRKNGAVLRSVSGRIDRLYLDSTYCSTKKVLPRQSDAINFIADRCQSLVEGADTENADDLLILIGTYSIGKERILQRVAAQCRCPLFIGSSKRNIFAAVYGADDPLNGGMFTINERESKIKVVSMSDINFSKMHKFKTKDTTKVIGFRPTGWASKDGGGRRGSDQHVISPRYWLKAGGSSMVIYDVPYSEHSSFPELCKFINDVCPKHIVPTVQNWRRSSIQRQIQFLESGMESFAVNGGYRYLPLVEDNGLKQTSITQFILTKTSRETTLCDDVVKVTEQKK